jgi:hypothetical protein
VALRAWADRLGVDVVAEYVDQASGVRADRTALRALLEAAHRRHSDARFARRTLRGTAASPIQ